MFFPIAMNGACDIHFFLKKEDQISNFHEKKKKCLPLFVEVDILGLSEIFCFGVIAHIANCKRINF